MRTAARVAPTRAHHAVIIIHGTGGSPEGNWFPWLSQELERLGCTVIVPRFPPPERQSLESWMAVFEPHWKQLDYDTIVVGHSIGAAFLLNVLEKTSIPVKAAFFVAGFIGTLGNPKFDPFNRTFAERDFDWELIRAHCGQFYLLNAENDPYVPLENARSLAAGVRAPLTLIHNGGHLNVESGYTSFPLLLDLIKGELE